MPATVSFGSYRPDRKAANMPPHNAAGFYKDVDGFFAGTPENKPPSRWVNTIMPGQHKPQTDQDIYMAPSGACHHNPHQATRK